MRIPAKSEYFQTIARILFSLRGAPFFVSSREMEVLETWFAQKIPLKVVLEGIKLAYEDSRRRPKKQRKKLSLNQCHGWVLQNFKQHEERKIGSQQRPIQPEDKINRLQKEIERFLAEMSKEVAGVKNIYAKIHEELAGGDWDEVRLERYEDQVESKLWELASAEQKQAFTDEIADNYKVQDLMEADRLVKIKWIKFVRDKYKIPHISLFYY